MSDDADEREQAEAEALARALDDSPERAEPPEDALEAAALLRYSGPEGELAPERAEAVLAELLPQVGRAKVSRVRVLAWTSGLLAAAAALLVFYTRPPASDELTQVEFRAAPAQQMEPASLPAPPAALLAAQAGATRAKDEGARARLEAEMRAYRQALLRALERAYPVRVGMLQTRGRP